MATNIEIRFLANWCWINLYHTWPWFIWCIFHLLTRVYTTAGVPVVSPGKDIPGVVEVLHELGYLNDRPIAAFTPDQSFSRQRDCNNEGGWTAERLDSERKWHEHWLVIKITVYINMYKEISTISSLSSTGSLTPSTQTCHSLFPELHCCVIWNS